MRQDGERRLDRSLRQRVPLLALRMGTTVQHALGSLLEWLDLAAPLWLVGQLAELGEQRLLLSAEQVERTFRAASGCQVSAADLCTLGFLRAEGQCFVVEGLAGDFAAARQAREVR